jgi:hypothetical protein
MAPGGAFTVPSLAAWVTVLSTPAPSLPRPSSIGAHSWCGPAKGSSISDSTAAARATRHADAGPSERRTHDAHNVVPAAPHRRTDRRTRRGRRSNRRRAATADAKVPQNAPAELRGASPMCRWMASLASRCLAPTITQREDLADSGQSLFRDGTAGQILLTASSRHCETSAVPRREHGDLCHPTCHLLSEARCVQHDSVRTRSLVSRASWGPPTSVRNRLRPLKVATRVRIPLGGASHASPRHGRRRAGSGRPRARRISADVPRPCQNEPMVAWARPPDGRGPAGGLLPTSRDYDGPVDHDDRSRSAASFFAETDAAIPSPARGGRARRSAPPAPSSAPCGSASEVGDD